MWVEISTLFYVSRADAVILAALLMHFPGNYSSFVLQASFSLMRKMLSFA